DNIIDLFNNNFVKFINDFVLLTKEPAQFISCIIAYNNYINYKKDIKIPILFDATCSGVQHLSVLTSDLDLAKLVNVLNNPDSELEGPADFYSFCIKFINQVIEEISEEKIPFKNKILNLNLNRNFLKTSIMTVAYNVTTIGIADKLATSFNKKFIKFEEAYELVKNNKIDINILEKLEQNAINKLIRTENKKNKVLKNKIIKTKINNNQTSFQSDIIFKESIKKENIDLNLKNKGIFIFTPKSEIIKNLESNEIIFTQTEINILANIVRTTVLNIIPPFTKLRDYFNEIIDILYRLNTPIF